MKNDKTLREISRLLQIPKPTLLYWEKEGLIHFERDPGNNYRRVTPAALFELDQAVLYRNMEIPIRQIRQIPHMALSELEELFGRSNQQLEAKISTLRQAQRRSGEYLSRIHEVRRLSEQPYQVEQPDFEWVTEFRAEAHWSVSNMQPDLFVLVIFPRESHALLEGFAGCAAPQSSVLWRKSGRVESWRTFILKMEVRDGSRKNSDLETHLGRLERMGYSSDLILARYMAEAAEEGTYYFYYKAWARVVDKGETEPCGGESPFLRKL